MPGAEVLTVSSSSPAPPLPHQHTRTQSSRESGEWAGRVPLTHSGGRGPGGLFDVVEERDDRVFQRDFHLVHVCFCHHAASMQSRGTMTCQHTGSGPYASFHSGRYLLCKGGGGVLPSPPVPLFPTAASSFLPVLCCAAFYRGEPLPSLGFSRST